MEDQQIIALYFARNEQAIRETDVKYGAYCAQTARRILQSNEDVEECVSDTWMRAWNAIPPTRPTVLKMFLAKITRNLSFNRYKALHAAKRGGAEVEAVLDELAECVGDVRGEASSVEHRVIANELSALIDRFVRELPEREGNIFIRRYFFTEPVEHVARRYGLTANNVSVILNRTRKKLKSRLAAEGYPV